MLVSESTAQVWLPPAVIEVAVEISTTWIGSAERLYELKWSSTPSPSWPRPLCPQQRASPFERTAQLCAPPAAMATAVEISCTETGVE